MKYSDRVTAITNIIQNCSCLLDIGCDHGYVCIISCENGKADRAIASDINAGPLQKASDNIIRAGLSDRISTVLSDGLQNIEDSFDAVCICGMGGLLIKDIIDKGKNRLKNVRQMVLGPHSELFALRKYIFEETKFYILNETVISEDGKYYSLWDVRNKADKSDGIIPSDGYLMFGNPYIQTDLTEYREMLGFELSKRRKAINAISVSAGEKAFTKKNEISREISLLNSLLDITGE